MAIIGVEGGIGTGKTMLLVYYGMADLMKGKRIYSNITLKNLPPKFRKNVTYLTRDELKNILELVKNKTLDMRNSTVLIQEAHNYIDSRTAMFKGNRLISYWILQSRHTGQGSCDIVYDTQELGQVDIRLRRNTDYVLRPSITKIDEKGLPVDIYISGFCKLGHRHVRFVDVVNVKGIYKNYDTHEIVEI